MIITTTETIPGKEIIEVKDVVVGSTIKTKHLGKDILAGFANMFGQELTEYNNMMSEARNEAVSRMKKEADKLGANAVICVRISPGASIMNGAAEVVAYGTAVIIK